jgi:hypothetical protein
MTLHLMLDARPKLNLEISLDRNSVLKISTATALVGTNRTFKLGISRTLVAALSICTAVVVVVTSPSHCRAQS